MAQIIIGKFGPSACQILDAALAIAEKPGSTLVVKSMPEGSTVFGGAEWSGRRKKDYERGLGYLNELTSRSLKAQVFLGGACGIPWRNEITIPILETFACKFYNPEVADWDIQDARLKAGGLAGGIMELEAIHKNASYVLLFVFDSATRAIATLNECVEYMMAGRQKVVIVEAFVTAGTVVGDQALTVEEAEDINAARAQLFHMAKGRGIPVFPSIDEATRECVAYLTNADMDYDVIGCVA